MGLYGTALRNKKHMMKKLLMLLVAATALVVGITGCHTAHGAGEDISSVGDKVQEHTP